MVDCCEAYSPTQREEEWDLVDEEDIQREDNIPVESLYFRRYFYEISGHRDGFVPDGLSLESSNVLTPDFECDIHVIDGHWTVFYLGTLHDPPKVLS
jgi:hypothetical protein